MYLCVCVCVCVGVGVGVGVGGWVGGREGVGGSGRVCLCERGGGSVKVGSRCKRGRKYEVCLSQRAK